MPITRRQALLSGGIAAVGSFAAFGSPAGSSAPKAEPMGLELACLTDFEPAAKARMPLPAWEYINGAAADELTVRWNREAYQNIRLKPNVLVDVSAIDTSILLFGKKLAFPILLAPTAYHKLVHPDGELATVRGAGRAAATLIASSFATTTIEEMTAAASGPIWFQLYLQRDRAFTRDLVQRAEAAGCGALCVTVDSPVAGPRNREDRISFDLPPGMDKANLRKLDTSRVTFSDSDRRPADRSIYSADANPAATWKDVEWLRSFAKVPVLLKGVLNPDDGDRAVQSGASGVIVSNHGGRDLDTAPATIEALPLVVDKIAGRVPVLVDGGIRRGTDVLKALALGAKAVLIGRPYVYGLSVAGEAGVARVVEILRAELEMAMGLTGRPTIASIDRSVIWV